MSESRDQFEALATAQGLSVVRTKQALMFANGSQRRPGDYIDFGTLTAWWGWQASRQALEIQLPIRASDHHDPQGSSDPISRAYDLGVTDCAAFIAEQGIRTKP